MKEVLVKITEEFSKCNNSEEKQMLWDLLTFINHYDISIKILKDHNEEIVRYNKNKDEGRKL